MNVVAVGSPSDGCHCRNAPILLSFVTTFVARHFNPGHATIRDSWQSISVQMYVFDCDRPGPVHATIRAKLANRAGRRRAMDAAAPFTCKPRAAGRADGPQSGNRLCSETPAG